MSLLKLNRFRFLLVDRKQLGWLELIKIIFGLMLFVAIASFDNHDPSLFNLLSTQGGISNYFGLPGALFTGLLKDVFGQMALIVPMVMVFVGTKDSRVSWKTAMLTMLELFLVVTLISFMFSKTDSGLIEYTGLWGHVSNTSLAEPFWKNVGFIIIFGYQILFFRLFRLNPIVLVVFVELCKLGKNWSLKFLFKVKTKVIKLWQFSTLNWLDPFKSLWTKNYEKSVSGISHSYEYFWNRVAEIGIIQKTIAMFSHGVSDDKANYEQKVVLALESASKSKSTILLRSVQEYEKRFLYSDTKAFIDCCES